MARGLWVGSLVAFFNYRIVDSKAPNYVQANLSGEAIANRAASTKKAKYHFAVEELRASFTPLVCSKEGVLHCEYAAYQKQLACSLVNKWQEPFFVTMAWVLIHMQFAIFHFVDLCLYGTCCWICGLGLQDGATIVVGY